MNATELKTNASRPEASLIEVANGNYAGLARPILVAAKSREQFEEFMWREGFLCTELRRFRDYRHHPHWPQDKILITLDGFWEDQKTDEGVRWWVEHEDRYSVLICDGDRQEDRGSWVMFAVVVSTAAGLLLASWAAAMFCGTF